MDISVISNAAVMAQHSQTRRDAGTAILKQALEQQAMVADMLEKVARQLPANTKSSGFSIYV